MMDRSLVEHVGIPSSSIHALYDKLMKQTTRPALTQSFEVNDYAITV